ELTAANLSSLGARAKIRELLAGNICRCTGYQLIVDAIVVAAKSVASEGQQ
nr:(2Fe-2S)-binding protein [Deltaproteobacteria bacterium]